MHFNGRNVNLCHGLFTLPLLSVQSPLRANQRRGSPAAAHLAALLFILRFSTSGPTERRKKKTPSDSFFLFFCLSLEDAGCSLHPPRDEEALVCCLFIPSRLLDQSRHSCDKQTDKRMEVASVRLLIYKQTRRLFFKRKLYGTFSSCWFFLFVCLVYSVSPTPLRLD